MILSIPQLFAYSFVISINQPILTRFYKLFTDNSLLPLPKHILGIQFPKNNQLNQTKNSLYLKKHLSAMTTHRMIISMAKAMNWPFVCIFEDDAVPRKNIYNKLLNIISDIPDQADILIFGNIHTFKTKPYNDKYVLPEKTWGLQSYVVFSKNYDYFLEAIDKNTTEGLSFYGKNVFLVKEQLFIQYQKHKTSISNLTGFCHFNYSSDFFCREFLPTLKASSLI